MDLQRKIIDVPPSDVAKDKIVIVKTSRYNNFFFDWKKLKEWKDHFIFISLDAEHEAFCKDIFEVERYKAEDALDVAKAMSGAKLVIGNQGGLYAIAEMMKAPRCLATAEMMKHNDRIFPGPVNVLPQGGKATIAPVVAKAVDAIEEALE